MVWKGLENNFLVYIGIEIQEKVNFTISDTDCITGLSISTTNDRWIAMCFRELNERVT